MKIPKRADITDTFGCPRYPELKPITYKLCLGRQLTKLAGGGWQYPDCVECIMGMAITEHFEGYQLPVKRGAKPNWNTDVIMNAENIKKIKKGKCCDNTQYIPVEMIDCNNCQFKNLIKKRINLILDLLINNEIDGALRHLGLVLEEM